MGEPGAGKSRTETNRAEPSPAEPNGAGQSRTEPRRSAEDAGLEAQPRLPPLRPTPLLVQFNVKKNKKRIIII